MNSKYRFKIEGNFTPNTLPMARLAEYAAALARLLGETAYVHFHAVEEGSAVLVAAIDAPAAPKIQERVTALRDGHGTGDAIKAFSEMDELLRKDNATGTGTLSGVTDPVVIQFPGRNRPEPLIFGPFRQDGTLTGQLIRVGGRDETVPVNLRDGQIILTGLNCTQELARRIAPHLYGPILKVHGTGNWIRTGAGVWDLQSFKITDFEILDDIPLLTVVEHLRKVKGSEWSQIPDPVLTLLKERHGDGDVH